MIASLASWIQHPIYSLFLTLDGIVYSLVSYSYKVFMLMTQLNYNVIYTMMAPLINRIKSLIIVFILFKAAVAFLGYLVEPEKFDDKTKGGKALFLNIMIACCLLGIYSFVFKLGNDLSMLMLGTFGGQSSFQVIKPEGGGDLSGGLIARFVFGNTNSKPENFGKYLAATTLNIFVYDKTDTAHEATSIYEKIINNENENEDFDFMEIANLADDIGRTVAYKFPLLSTVMGLYLIYSIVKIAIEVGVRMFKLIVLQIIAPIPIVSIISDGVNGGMFKKYTSLYIGTLTSVFIRVASMYVITGFIAEFQKQLFGTGANENLFSSATSANFSFFTKCIIFIILVVAGYTFVNQLPKFLGQIFGDVFGSEGKGSFGKFLKGVGSVAGSTLGATAGALGGAVAGGIAGGFGGALGGLVSGGVDGAKGKKISESVKNSAALGKNISDSKGLLGFGANQALEGLGINEMRNAAKDKQIATENSTIKSNEKAIQSLQNANSAIRTNHAKAASAIRNGTITVAGSNYSRVGSATDLAQKMKDSSSSLAREKYKMEVAKSSGNEADYLAAVQSYTAAEQTIEKDAENAYNYEMGIKLGGNATTYTDQQKQMIKNDSDISSLQTDNASRSSNVAQNESLKGKGIIHK